MTALSFSTAVHTLPIQPLGYLNVIVKGPVARSARDQNRYPCFSAILPCCQEFIRKPLELSLCAVMGVKYPVPDLLHGVNRQP